MSGEARLMPEHHPMYACSGGCGGNVSALGEYPFMLRKLTWRETAGRRGLLCVGCVEKRLGRLLTRRDFDWTVPLNTVTCMGPRSPRLLAAMARE